MEAKHEFNPHTICEKAEGSSDGTSTQESQLPPCDNHSLTPVENDREAAVSGTMQARTVIALVIANTTLLLVGLDNTIVSTALPAIVDDLHQLNHISWYGSAFLVGMATTQSFWGKVLTYWRIKHVYVLAICIFEAGNALCATAKRDDIFIFGRALAGAGGAGVMAGTFLITALVVSPVKRPVVLGLVSATLVFAAIIGPPIGGAFVSRLSWRWGFYLNLPLGGISILIMAWCLTVPCNGAVDLPIKKKLLQLDIPGMLLTIGFVTFFLQALVWGGVTEPWSSSKVIACLVASFVFLALLVATEILSGKKAAIDCKLMRLRTVALQLPFALAITSTFYLVLYYIPMYFQAVLGVDALQSGLRTVPLTSISGLTAALTGVLLSVTGEYQVIMLASGLLASIGAGLIHTLDTTTSTAEHVGFQAVLALGTGLGYFLGVTVCQDMVPKHELAQANATILSLQLLANALTLAVGQSVFSNVLLSSLRIRAPSVAPATILAAGPVRLRSLLPEDLVEDVIECYLLGLRNVFTLALALCLVSVIASVAALVFDRRKLNQAKGGKITPSERVLASGEQIPDRASLLQTA